MTFYFVHILRQTQYNRIVTISWQSRTAKSKKKVLVPKKLIIFWNVFNPIKWSFILLKGFFLPKIMTLVDWVICYFIKVILELYQDEGFLETSWGIMFLNSNFRIRWIRALLLKYFTIVFICTVLYIQFMNLK